MTLPGNIASLGIDPQKTFCEGGGLAVAGGNGIMPEGNKIRSQTVKGYWTQDWHPAGHSSFATTHQRPPFTQVWLKDGKIVADFEEGQTQDQPPVDGAIIQMLWTDHGVQNTADAEFHPDLVIPAMDKILRKGDNPLIDSYSCVFENDKITRPRFQNGETLPDQMRIDGIDTAIMWGLAGDVCVPAGAIDLKAEGFRVIVVQSATAYISPEGKANTLKRYAALGIEVVESPEDLDAYLSAHPTAPSLSPEP